MGRTVEQLAMHKDRSLMPMKVTSEWRKRDVVVLALESTALKHGTLCQECHMCVHHPIVPGRAS